MHASGNSVTAFVIFLVLQVVIVIIFAALGRYDKELLPSAAVEDGDSATSVDEVAPSKYPRM